LIVTLLLKRADIASLLDLKQAMKVLEQTFREQAEGKVAQVAPLRLMDRGMRMVVGALEARDKTGFRVSVTGGEAMALLFGIESGDFLALMGYPFSNLRISATVGLAIDRFADPKARTAAMIGSGRLALSALTPAVAVRPIEKVLVYSRTPDNRENFARQAEAQLNIPVQAVASPEQAIDAADLVLVSTNSSTAVLKGEWLRPGLSIFAIGRPNELDDQVFLRAGLICVTSKTHELGYYDSKLDQPLIRLSRAGTIAWDAVVELGDVIAGKAAPPDRANHIVVFRDSQGGYGDLALAAYAYEEARKRGLGHEISVE
jgi:alanine dehydrogenase